MKRPRVLFKIEVTTDDLLALLGGVIVAGIFVGWLILDAGWHGPKL